MVWGQCSKVQLGEICTGARARQHDDACTTAISCQPLAGRLMRPRVTLLYYLRGTIVIRTFDQYKNLDIPVFLPTVFGPDYYVPQ